ncbi:GNAT family N-acetyltransferase [Mesobacillus subterraneus]|uniref:GNAT family N-acetyltransferase n=1 Tax=Mesobacillus subterraneus TaxID=285983 RepID=UPI001CFEE720|nr:GNAT family N-acetyltransferase [Mesobacillus subterraneus]WLR57741.1 GNAT family N-acetyltransferase [Mesobacillus subterraneus]
MVCAEVLDLQRKSYRIEADLIGTDVIPPLKETFEQLQGCGETFIGCYIDGKLAGAVSYINEGKLLDIYRMMVHPEFFRRGIAQKLITQLEQMGYSEMIVSTGAGNTPAVKLYEKLGFERQDDSVVGNGLVIANFKKRQVSC